MSAPTASLWPDLVALSQLDPHPDNPRLALREDVVEQIAGQLVGGFHPSHAIRCRETGGGRYQIVSGHHRVEAARRAGLEFVPAWVLELEDDEAFMALVLDNAQGELSPLEVGLHALKAVPKARGKKGAGLAAYAKRVGRSKDYISKMRMAAEVASEVSTQVDKSGLLNYARHLSEIHKADRELWPVLAGALLQRGWTVKDTARHVEKVGTFPPSGGLPPWLPLAELVARHLEAPERFTPARVERLRAAEDTARELIRGFEGSPGANVAAELDALDAWLLERKGAESWDHREIERYGREVAARLERAKEGAWLCGDWREQIGSLADGSVALLLTDPPYGQGYQSDHRQDRTKAKRHKAIEGDDSTAEFAAMAAAFAPKLRDDAHVLMFCAASGELEAEAIAALKAAGLTYRGTLVWDKQSTGMGDPYTTFAPAFEQIVHAVKGSPTLLERAPSLLSHPRVGADRHPTEKPAELLRRLVKATTAAGELVADPFGGVASTAFAAREEGRCFWSCELDQAYYEAGEERLS